MRLGIVFCKSFYAWNKGFSLKLTHLYLKTLQILTVTMLQAQAFSGETPCLWINSCLRFEITYCFVCTVKQLPC
jgi:hypothetical protein